MPLFVSSLIAFSFFDRCASPMPRSTFGAFVNWILSYPTISMRLPHGSRKSRNGPGSGSIAGVSQRFADSVLIIDHKAKMAVIVGWLGAALLQREELVAQIDEGRCLALAAKLEVEQATIEGQSLFDVTNFDSDMVETDGTRFLCFRHKASQSF